MLVEKPGRAGKQRQVGGFHPLCPLSSAGICCRTSTASPEAAYGTLPWAPQDTPHGMAMTRGKQTPMSPIPCLILAAASCFAKLSEFLFLPICSISFMFCLDAVYHSHASSTKWFPLSAASSIALITGLGSNTPPEEKEIQSELDISVWWCQEEMGLVCISKH